MQIVTKLAPWPSDLHRISINSFGYGGANAHAILESVDSLLPGYSQERRQRMDSDPTKLYLVPFSGSTSSSLEARVLDIGKRFLEGEKYDFRDLCFTLADRRSNLSKKGFLLARGATNSADFALERLVTPKQKVPVLELSFVFTGRGAQWPQMGKELLEKYPTFAATIESLDAVLAALPEAPSWTIKDALLRPAAASKVNEAALAQPLCPAIQVGIVKLLHKWGIAPRAVVGHSSGEIAAAFAAGFLTEAQAIMVSEISSDGCMVAVGMNADRGDQIIEELGLRDQICVACVNSPESITMSGASHGIQSLIKHLEKTGTFARRLLTGGRGYHSFLMKEVGAEYEQLITKALNNLPKLSDVSDEKDISQNDKEVRFLSSIGKDDEALPSFSVKSTPFLKPV